MHIGTISDDSAFYRHSGGTLTKPQSVPPGMGEQLASLLLADDVLAPLTAKITEHCTAMLKAIAELPDVCDRVIPGLRAAGEPCPDPDDVRLWSEDVIRVTRELLERGAALFVTPC